MPLKSVVLHADQLFVDDAQSAVSGLDKRNTVVGVADALIEGGNVGAHEFADGQTGGVVSSAVDAHAGGQALGRGLQVAIVAGQSVGNVGGHSVVIDIHNIPP